MNKEIAAATLRSGQRSASLGGDLAAVPMIELRGVTKRFGELTVVKSVDLSVRKSEVVCLIGPSGSGKSTLLRCMAFLEAYDDGAVLIEGELLGYRDDSRGQRRRASDREIARVRRNVGMVFQQFHLWPHMTALGNVMEALVMVRRRSKEEARAIAVRMLDKVGLAAKADSYPAQLSGGQQQRVAIARSLAIDPHVMLFDEPTSSLDPELVGEVLAVMKDLAAEGMTMVVVTHEMGFAAQVGDTIAFLDHGEILARGSPADVFRDQNHPRIRQFLQNYLDRNAFWS
ncbi:MAG TPA: amino acid ABC transporter ATP-binding protein [Dongiaceae bacterium]|jgi:polar amino acid transport system ATP-binding protein|nr:amino acid ABC transporter ATP-binding protein [Dongiaceae bacterium]